MNLAVHEALRPQSGLMELTFQKERKTELQGYHCDRCQEAGSQGPGWTGAQVVRGQKGSLEEVTHALRQDAVGHVAWWEWHAPSNPRKAEVPQSEETRQTWAAGL